MDRKDALQQALAEAQQQQQAAYQVIDQSTRRIIALTAKLELLAELEIEVASNG